MMNYEQKLKDFILENKISQLSSWKLEDDPNVEKLGSYLAYKSSNEINPLGDQENPPADIEQVCKGVYKSLTSTLKSMVGECFKCNSFIYEGDKMGMCSNEKSPSENGYGCWRAANQILTNSSDLKFAIYNIGLPVVVKSQVTDDCEVYNMIELKRSVNEAFRKIQDFNKDKIAFMKVGHYVHLSEPDG